MESLLIPDWLKRWAVMAVMGACLFGFGFLKGCQHGSAEHEIYLARMEAESARVLASAEARNNRNAESWRLYARSIQDAQTADQADNLRRGNAAAGVRLRDPGQSGGSTTAQAEGTPGLPADPAAGAELSPVLDGFLKRQALRANAAAIYARDARAVALECLARSAE